MPDFETTFTVQGVAISDEARQRAKEHLQALSTLGVISMSESGIAELGATIDTMPIYLTGNISSLQTTSGLPYRIEIANPSSYCAVGIGDIPQGTQLDDVWNKNASTTYDYSWGIMNFSETSYTELPCILNLISRGIDEGIIEPSDELKEWIDDNTVTLPTDYSIHWDVYIHGYKEKVTGGGYFTESITVRWSNPAINKGTDDYIALHPDYTPTAANTLIELAADSEIGRTTKKAFFATRYGELEATIPMSRLSAEAGTGDLMKWISEFIPSSTAGDVWLFLRYNMDHGAIASDICIAQIPLNLTSQDVSHLRTVRGRLGSNVTIHFGEPEEGVPDDVVGWNDDVRDPIIDDVPIFDPDLSDVVTSTNTNNHSIGVLSTTYAITESNLQSLGQKLWDDSFLDNISMINNSPIENILAVKAFPFPIDTTGGSSASVKLGNVDMNVSAVKIPPTYNPIRTIGSVSIPKHFSGHLQWLNYMTNIRLYLPFVGFVEIPIQEAIGKTLTVKYIHDLICGDCLACIYAAGIEIAKYSGNIAIDIPITASNRAQVEAGILSSGISALASLATGNLMGVIGSAFGALTNQNHFVTKGAPSPSCDSYDEQRAFFIIERPVYHEPATYAHEYGYPCNLSLSLKNCKGFTKCHNVDVSGIPCTEKERDEIKAALERGVRINA